METIQVQVPLELAQRLRLHYDELPQILEWGLRHVETESESFRSLARQPSPQREEVLAALRSTGLLVELDPAIAARYQAVTDPQRHIPVQVSGKPLSEMIIEERNRRWPNNP